MFILQSHLSRRSGTIFLRSLSSPLAPSLLVRNASTLAGGSPVHGRHQLQLRKSTQDKLIRPCIEHRIKSPRPSNLDLLPQVRSHSTQPAAQHQPTYSLRTISIHDPIIHPIFEATTGTFQYIVTDPSSKASAIIDPVLDFDPATQAITTKSADALLALIAKENYIVQYILETHAHADHLSAASYLQRCLTQSQSHRPLIGIGKRIGQVQTLFGQRYQVPAREYEVVFDKLFEDDEVVSIGALDVAAMHLPGHTPDHLGYKIGGKSHTLRL